VRSKVPARPLRNRRAQEATPAKPELINTYLNVGGGPATVFGLSAAPIRLNPVQQTGICRVLWERAAVRSKMLGTATFYLAFQLLAAASAPAQGPQPPTPPAAPPPFSGIARNVVTWLHHVTRTGTHRRRIVSSPPLPRPRPAQLTKAPELPTAAVEPNETQPAPAAVEPNKMSPAPAAVEPNKMSPAPAATVEPDKAPAELHETPPAASAVEPSKVSPAPGPTVEAHKTPAELQTKTPGAPTGTVLQGANIPD
jgi:hypothetical protein